MADIFISYSRSDRDKAKQIAEALEKRGRSVWWDRELLAGQKFTEVIAKELEDSKCILVLWSEESVQGGWVLDEAREGANMGKLIPVLIDAVDPPLGFRQIHSTDLTNWDSGFPHEEFKRVLRAVKNIVGEAQGERTDEEHPEEVEVAPPKSKTNIAATLIVSIIVAFITFFTTSFYYTNRSGNLEEVRENFNKEIASKKSEIASLYEKLKIMEANCEKRTTGPTVEDLWREYDDEIKVRE